MSLFFPFVHDVQPGTLSTVRGVPHPLVLSRSCSTHPAAQFTASGWKGFSVCKHSHAATYAHSRTQKTERERERERENKVILSKLVPDRDRYYPPCPRPDLICMKESASRVLCLCTRVLSRLGRGSGWWFVIVIIFCRSPRLLISHTPFFPLLRLNIQVQCDHPQIPKVPTYFLTCPGCSSTHSLPNKRGYCVCTTTQRDRRCSCILLWTCTSLSVLSRDHVCPP